MNEHLKGLLLPLAPRQKETLDFMWSFFKENDTLPSMPELKRKFSVTNQAIQDMRSALMRKGYIERNAVNKYRFTALFHAEQERADDNQG